MTPLVFPASAARGILGQARRLGAAEVQYVDDSDRVVATLTIHTSPSRPALVPRSRRVKHKLSKRQRDQAKREKLRERAIASGMAQGVALATPTAGTSVPRPGVIPD